MCPPPARSSIACSITPRSSLSMDEATDSSQKLNNPLRSAPDRPKQVQIRHKRTLPRSGALHLFRFRTCFGRSPRKERSPHFASDCRSLVPRSHQSPAKTIYHRSEEHTSELQSHLNLVCRLL